jgi:predicted nuclease of predicted toxin-antitoxin system
MSVKLVIDMNLSPAWATFLEGQGWTATHWSEVGDPRATDRTIIDWALANGRVVFTHDLDFGTMLALTRSTGPSVLQVRGRDLFPDRLGRMVVATLRQCEAELAAGALVVVDAKRCRVRILPLS